MENNSQPPAPAAPAKVMPPTKENNSQPPAPAAPAKVTPPGKELPKTTQASSNHEVMPMAARTAATAGSAGQPQGGTAVGSVQKHFQPLSRRMRQVLAGAGAGTGTGSMFGTTAQCGAGTGTGTSATMPRLRPLACKPVQQTTPVVFVRGSSSSNQAMQGSSSTKAVAATTLAAAAHGPTAQHGAAVPLLLPPAPLRAVPIRAVRPTKRMITRPSSPPPAKLPVYYRHPPPPRPEVASSSAAGNALFQSPSDAGFGVSNMQANPPPSPGQVASAEEASNSEGGGGRGGDVKILDLNFPPDSDDEN